MPNRGGLAEAELVTLVHGLVRQRPGARHDAHVARPVDVARMIPIFTGPGDDAGQFGRIKPHAFGSTTGFTASMSAPGRLA